MSIFKHLNKILLFENSSLFKWIKSFVEGSFWKFRILKKPQDGISAICISLHRERRIYLDSVPEQKLHFNYSFLTLIVIVQRAVVSLIIVNLPKKGLIRIKFRTLVLTNFFCRYLLCRMIHML